MSRVKRRRRLRGKFFWKEEFYSICSRHFNWREDCPLCQKGEWINLWVHHVSSMVHDWAYPVWYWWVNRPNSRSRRRLEELFPGLKGKGKS